MARFGAGSSVRRRGAGLALAGAFLLGAGSAAADTNLGRAGGVTYIVDTTPSAPAPYPAQAVAACPETMHPLGGGIYPSGDAGQAWVEGLDGWGVPLGWWGYFMNASGPEKTADVFAMCTAKRVRQERAHTSVPEGQARTRRARCPNGTRVTGGGANGLQPSGRIVSSHPFDGRDKDRVPDDGWAARAYRFPGGTYGDLYVDAHCLAGKGASKRLGYKTSSGPSVDCPDDAHLTGGGIRHRASDASVAWINTSAPIDTVLGGDTDDIPDDFWYGRLPAYPRTIYAICLKEKQG
jgi:hypothetical protein